MDWRTAPSNEKYGMYLASREWSRLKNAVHKRAGGMCERCHHRKIDAVHHNNYTRIYKEKLTDLEGLCFPCHQFKHDKIGDDPIYDMDEEWQPHVPVSTAMKWMESAAAEARQMCKYEQEMRDLALNICHKCGEHGDLVGRTGDKWFCELCSVSFNNPNYEPVFGADESSDRYSVSDLSMLFSSAIEILPDEIRLKIRNQINRIHSFKNSLITISTCTPQNAIDLKTHIKDAFEAALEDLSARGILQDHHICFDNFCRNGEYPYSCVRTPDSERGPRPSAAHNDGQKKESA